MEKLVILIIALFLFGVNCEKKKGESQKIEVNPIDFTLKDLQGNEWTLRKQKGKVIILDFWATWCKPCVATIPIFNELYEKYNDKGLLILGIGLDEEQALRRFMESHNISYPVLIGNREIAQKYRIYAIPSTFVIDKEGKITSRHVGLEPEMQTTLEEEIKKLLK